MSEQSALFLAMVDGDTPTALAEVNNLIAQDVPPQNIMEEHLIPAMGEVGRLFEENEFFVPELLIAARAMQESMKILNPLLKNSGIAKAGRVVIGTVQGDLHDIGKNLVAAMLEGGGFEVVDLGVDVTPEKFVAAAKEQSGTIIALSALLTTTMPQMKKVIEALQDAGIRGEAKVMIGGAPVTPEFATEIGADGYSENASTAVALARRFAA
jgi:corrinoid protein of di/trimethylamine methyltransferase